MQPLTIARVPQETFFILMTDVHNPQQPLYLAGGKLWILDKVLTGNEMPVRFLPVPEDVRRKLAEKNPRILLVSIPMETSHPRDRIKCMYGDSEELVRQARELLTVTMLGLTR